MEVEKLALALMKKEKLNGVQALSTAWRMINEYPELLHQIVRKWSDGEDVSNAGYGKYRIKEIIRRTGCSIIQAIEILYIVSKAPDKGEEFIGLCTIRDVIQRG